MPSTQGRGVRQRRLERRSAADAPNGLSVAGGAVRAPPASAEVSHAAADALDLLVERRVFACSPCCSRIADVLFVRVCRRGAADDVRSALPAPRRFFCIGGRSTLLLRPGRRRSTSCGRSSRNHHQSHHQNCLSASARLRFSTLSRPFRHFDDSTVASPLRCAILPPSVYRPSRQGARFRADQQRKACRTSQHFRCCGCRRPRAAPAAPSPAPPIVRLTDCGG